MPQHRLGRPQNVADMLWRWVDESGIGGFTLAHAVTPGIVADFINYEIPQLQRRGRAQTEYAPCNSRQKPIGTADGRVESTRTAGAFHGAYAGPASVADKTSGSNVTHV